MTPEEREQLHCALFDRLLREVKSGSLVDAEKALDLMQGDTAAQTLAALMGHDN